MSKEKSHFGRMHGIFRYTGCRRTRGGMEDIDILWLRAQVVVAGQVVKGGLK